MPLFNWQCTRRQRDAQIEGRQACAGTGTGTASLLHRHGHGPSPAPAACFTALHVLGEFFVTVVALCSSAVVRAVGGCCCLGDEYSYCPSSSKSYSSCAGLVAPRFWSLLLSNSNNGHEDATQPSRLYSKQSKALFSSKLFFFKIDMVALSFIFDEYYPFMV